MNVSLAAESGISPRGGPHHNTSHAFNLQVERGRAGHTGAGTEGFLRFPSELSSRSGQPAHVYTRESGYRLSALVMGTEWATATLAIFVGLFWREAQRMGGWEVAADALSFNSPLVWWALCGGVLYCWLMLSYRSYELANLYRLQVWTHNLVRVLAIWAIGAWAVVGLFPDHLSAYSPRLGIAYCAVLMGASLVLVRLCTFGYLLHPAQKRAADARVLVIGWTKKADELREALRADPGQLSEIVGWVPIPGVPLNTRPPSDLPMFENYSELGRIVAEQEVSSIILSDVAISSSEIRCLIEFCQRELVPFRMIPEYFPALQSALEIENVAGVPLLGPTRLPLSRARNRVIKRAIDIVGGLIGLAVSIPVIALFGLIVYWQSPGPVIYKQWRTSRHGRKFKIYKIRSMKLDAEAGTGAVWCKAVDDRRLPIGTLMRKLNIDELPQFWNVLKGDMSLVGPRPERPELIARFKDEIPNYNVRHEVKAGLTGWAQIKGWRGDTDLSKRIEADMYYMENWSVTLDLYCMLRTFVGNKNAY